MKKEYTKEEKEAYKKVAKEREDQARESIHGLARNFRESPENITEFLQFGAGFYQYSPRNTMLIYTQNRGATFVRSFKDWKDMGYSVRKGEHGMSILVPVNCTYLKQGEELIPLRDATPEQKKLLQNKQIESVSVLRFKIGSVFDISQTNFPKEKYPEIYAKGYESEAHENLFRALESYAKEKLQVETSIQDMKSIALNGLYHPGTNRITINNLLESTNKLGTMSHELGHALLHNKPEWRDKTTSQIEYEADCMSILFYTHLGLDIPTSRERHLATHFNGYMEQKKESISKEFPDLSEEERLLKLNEEVENSFNTVFTTYQTAIKDLQPYIDEALKENDLEIEEDPMKKCMKRTAARTPRNEQSRAIER